MNDTMVEIKVLHYFNHSIYLPHMSEHLFNLLNDAFIRKALTVRVPKEEFNEMIKGYFETLKN